MATIDERIQSMLDDFKAAGGQPLYTNMSRDTIAAQKAKEFNETNRMVLRDVGNPLSASTNEKLMRALNNYAYRMSGAGSFDNQYQNAFKGFDKYGYNPLAPNVELSGFTFITRPKLNLSPGAVSSDPILGLLDTTVPTSPLFAIRCLLDTKYCNDYEIKALQCKLIDIRSPFIKLLTNCSRSNSGWPDMNGDTHTTEGGYFNEDQTAFLGYDFLNRTYDINMEFIDIQGGHVMALFFYWFLWMAQVKRNRVMAYAEDIDARRLCYTCSIYRFVLDPSKQVITKWAKATGCFPKAPPIGACFNVNSGEYHVSSSQRFSIPFTANKIEYNDPRILADFNTVTRRFLPSIATGNIAPINDPGYNFIGRPYIRTENGAHRIVWYYAPDEEPSEGIDYILNVAKKEAAAAKPEPIQSSSSSGSNNTIIV